MSHNRLGLMGHYYGGMLDIYSDLTQHCATFGGHIEMLEVDELAALRRDVSAEQMRYRVAMFHEQFDVQPDCSPTELERAARTSVALDRLVAEHDLGSLAYYYRASAYAENEDAMSSIILGNSLLTARGIPVAGEYEVKNVQAMKMLDTFGAGGSFTEFYAMDYADDVVLMGHDGPGHLAIARGQDESPAARGVSRQGRPRSIGGDERASTGRSRCCRSSKAGAVHSACSSPRASRSRDRSWKSATRTAAIALPTGARRFVNDWNSHGPAHHCAVGVGHIADRIERLGSLLRIPVNRVC